MKSACKTHAVLFRVFLMCWWDVAPQRAAYAGPGVGHDLILEAVFPSAGFTAITTTNPIWLIKTRLQLDAR